jgi:hypothetical protein
MDGFKIVWRAASGRTPPPPLTAQVTSPSTSTPSPPSPPSPSTRPLSLTRPRRRRACATTSRPPPPDLKSTPTPSLAASRSYFGKVSSARHPHPPSGRPTVHFLPRQGHDVALRLPLICGRSVAGLWPTPQDYLRLCVAHAASPRWIYAFSDVGLDATAQVGG